MDWEAVGAIGEVIAALAVVVTLGYLATQIRQGINSVQGSTELEASMQFSQWHSRITNSPELRAIWDKAAAGEQLNAEEQSAYTWLFCELFFLLEGFFRQYRRGLLTESAWEPMKVSLLGMLQNEIVAEWWDGELGPVSGEFREYLNGVRGEDVELRLVDTRQLGSRKVDS